MKYLSFARSILREPQDRSFRFSCYRRTFTLELVERSGQATSTDELIEGAFTTEPVEVSGRTDKIRSQVNISDHMKLQKKSDKIPSVRPELAKGIRTEIV